MPNMNGHGLKRAILWVILYARVSTDEQARSGYSLAQQIEALREYAAREGYEVLEEVVDPGQSGASLERPGMDRVRDLVSAGGVSVVLAQDRDRFAREPAYHYLLRREFEEHGTKIRALNDRGDDSPEGELTDGILDQLAKFERAKMAERTRRGKLQKARSGKVVGGHPVNYGFRMNTARDAYEVDAPKMSVVRRIFRMIGEEGLAITAVAKILNKEGEPGPTGGRWSTKTVRWFVLDDVYKPHTPEEVAKLVSPEVAALLDRDRRYGIWWFNRERWRRTKISEPSPAGEGRDYRWKVVSNLRPREEWVAVPVPDSGIPRETVEAARHIVGNNVACSSNGDRLWELSGGVLRCSECGRRMRTSVTRKKDGKRYFYYSCASRREGKLSSCSNRKTHRAERIEPAVWDLVSALLTDPERLRAGLDEMMERERRGVRGDPDHEARVWLERLAEADRMRAGYQELAAKGLLTIEELSARLEELEATRRTAADELEAIRRRAERLAGLEHDRDALMEFYAGAVPEDLERLGPEERRRIYGMLRLEVLARPDGTLEARGILGESLRVDPEDRRAVCETALAPSPKKAKS
jgi:site-specific DNA recombinase